MASHSTIIKNFADRKVNKRAKGIEWRGHNVFCHDRMLFSYGRHFPLARYLGQDGDQHLFLRNGDTYSPTTSCHQGMTRSSCKGPSVSVEALASAGLEFDDLELSNIPFWRDNTDKFIYQDTETGLFYEECNYTGDYQVGWLDVTYTNDWTPPKIGHYVSYGNRGERFTYGRWEVLGGVVLVHNDQYFLCSTDEGNNFVSRLSQRPRSLDHAFKLLKPPQVRKAERLGNKNVQRQGEWFFVSTAFGDRALAALLGTNKTSLKKRSKPSPLPFVDEKSNHHVCRHFEAEGNTYAKGRVYHRWPFGKVTKKHKTLNLGDHWHLVYRNAELESWSN